ncbi:MAG: hypothetical protein QF917_04115 [Candidatus Woesearchaeota archaeon]|jgi:hypothetical protein|nr:hypothetical protein [Candidatus Woesearchaeota archaeon]|tara:strand:+ start:2723 stop:3370 length:648 start_codon:yes stop_codon:yes gene_type:complete
MKLFSFGGKKKKGPAAPGLPVDQIMAMKQQGMDNNQIVSEMEKQGYNSSQIFDALNQVNISGGNVGLEQPPGLGNIGQQQQSPQDFSYGMPQQQPEHVPREEPTMDKEQIEEIAEVIIDEKWKEFEEDVRIIIDWKEKTEARVNKLEQQIKDVEGTLNSLHKSIINKISDYDKNLTDVGTEIKVMEKVFQKVLPSLTENVNKLDRMTKSSKLGKK